MLKLRLSALALAVVLAGAPAARAGETIEYAPAPAWVKPPALPDRPAKPDSGAIESLLADSESRHGPDGDEFYEENAYRIVTPQGLAAAGTVGRVWDPVRETLIVHKVEIIRDGKAIDALAGGDRFLTLRQETSLNEAMLDGRLTATKQISGLQLGDILHTAWTVKRKDPALNGHTEMGHLAVFPTSVDRLQFRKLWPAERNMRWRVTEGFENPKVSKTAEGTELVVERTNFKSPTPPANAPPRYSLVALLEVTDFASWEEVSRLFAPTYARAATLAADSPLKAEAAKIRQAHASPEARALAALQLAQQQVRYFYLEVGEGGYTPAAADLTWTRRFGDCKGKTALLLALLAELGVKAEAVLVQSSGGDGIDALLPRPGLFDHVLVRAEIGGKSYWLDGARLGDRSLKDLPPPPSRWVLALRTAGAPLEKVDITPSTTPQLEELFEIDASGGFDAETPIKVQMTLRGEAAIAMQQQFEGAPREQMEKALLQTWNERLEGEFKTATYGFDAAEGAFTVTVEGKTKSAWRHDRGVGARIHWMRSSSYTLEFDKREAGQKADAPYAIGFPYFGRYVTRVKLPDKGVGFQLVGADVDQTLAQTAIRRASRLENGVAVTELTIKTLGPEVSAKEALAAGEATEKLPTKTQVWIRAPGGPDRPRVASAEKPTGEAKSGGAPKADAPKDAAGYVELARQHSMAARHQESLDAAQEAIRLEPENATAYVLRGMAYLQLAKSPLALADLDRAVALDPELTLTLAARAQAHYQLKDYARAMTDVEAALKLSPNAANLVQMRAMIAAASGAPMPKVANQMIEALDKLIAEQPDEAEPYLRRGAIHAGLGSNDKAMADFDRSIALGATAAAYFSRGWQHQRQKSGDKALADFDAALRLDPSAASYEERGRLKLQLKDYAGADRDFVESARLDPERISAKLNRVAIVAERGELPQAIAMADELAKTHPKSFELLRQRGVLHGRAKNYEKALEDFEQARPLANNDQWRWSILGDIASANERLGRYPAALAAHDAAVALRPTNALALNNRCWLKATRNVAADTALADCDEALRIAPGEPAYLDSRGLALLRAGRNAEALAAYEEALKKRTDFPTSLYGRGVAKRRLGDAKAAEADFAAAKAIRAEVVKDFADWGVTP